MLKPRFFPPPELSEPEGVVAFGGKLSPEWLLDAYSHGIFPWPIFYDTEILVWFSPDPRAIFELDGFRASRRLLRTIRSEKFEVTCDRDFVAVICGCASVRREDGGTWITPTMIEAYCEMHEMGHAHSIEVWHDGKLAGGTYGVAVGGLFAGESMFYRVTDASKVAVFYLIQHLRARGFRLFDIQQLTPHTKSLGAIEISRGEYLRRVVEAIPLPVTWGKSLQAGVEGLTTT
jgi:leucyl/phenylalanyl-tRNA---protein transferase